MVRELRVLMLTTGWPTVASPGEAPFVARQVQFLRRAGVQVDVFHFRGQTRPLNYVRAWWQVRRRISKNRYNLIHAQWGQSALAAVPQRLPLVVTFRGSDLMGFVGSTGRYKTSSRLLRAYSRYLARRADEVIVVAERLARHLPKRPYHLIPSGIDLELFQPASQTEARRTLGLPMDRRLILFPAAPDHPVKRFGLAQEAVAGLDGRFAAEMVGCGGVPYNLMPTYMNACDVLLLTSLHEGSPNAVKEALACNLPVVSVDVGDVRERVDSVEGSVVCEDDRPDTIATALAEVLSRSGRVDSRSAVSHLDERVLTRRVISVYRQAIHA